MRMRIQYIFMILIMGLFSCEKKESNPTPPIVPENRAPVLATICDPTLCSSIHAHLGDITYIELSATDLDEDLLTFSITTNPGFLSITDFSQTGDTATATLVMDPDMSLRDRQVAAIQVSDGKGGLDSESFEISFSYYRFRLYLCDWRDLGKNTYGGNNCSYAWDNNETIVFRGYYLNNDLVGTEYAFHLRCSCTSTREFSAAIKIGGSTVASTKFDVTGATERYDIYVEGKDPEITNRVEVELHVTINGTGTSSSLCWGWWDGYESYISLPPMDYDSD